MTDGDRDDEAASIGSAATASPDVAAVTVSIEDSPRAAAAAAAGDAATLTSSPDPAHPPTPEALPIVATEHYVMIDEFARGGLGRIMRARDLRTGRVVAIKEMLSSTADAAARFVREALVTANLQHPSIVPVYELGRWPSGQPFYAMKLVRGRPLAEVIDGCKDLGARLALLPHVVAIADALAYAHHERVIHRDLKPQNVICGAHGETVVIDWGLARRIDDPDAAAALPRINSAPPGATYVGAVLGTPAYMPPEQARGERVDGRADVYAIGAILYHVLAGAPPYVERSIDELIGQVRSRSPVPLATAAPGVPPDLATIVARAMARVADARYGSAAELAIELRRFTSGQLVMAHAYSVRERLVRFVARNRAALAIAAGALVALAIVGTVAVRRVVAARDVAEREQRRADVERDEAQSRLLSAYRDRARLELVADRPDRALAFAVAAAELGGLDDALRFAAQRMLDGAPAAYRVRARGAVAIGFAPASRDVLVTVPAGLERWSAERDERVWLAPGSAGDVVALDRTTIAIPRTDDVALVAAADGKPFATLPLHGPHVGSGLIAVDRDHRWIAVPTLDHQIDLFDVAARARVASIAVPDVDRVPVVADDGARLLVKLATKPPQLQIVERGGRTIATLCTDCYIAVQAGAELAFVVRRTGAPSRIVVADWNGRPRLDLAPLTTAEILDIGVDAARGRLALGLADGSVELHDLATGALTWRHDIRDQAFQTTFDGRGRLWVLGWREGVHLFDAGTGVALARWLGGGPALAVADDGERVAVLDELGAVSTWPVDAPTATAIAPTPARVRHLVQLADGRIVTGSADGTVAVFARGSYQILAKRAQPISALHALPDGSLVSSWPGGTAISKPGSLEAARELPHGRRAAVAPDGATIATGGDDGAVVLWDRASGERLGALGTFADPVFAVRWSSDGRHVVALDAKGALRAWTGAGKLVHDLPAITVGIDVALSHDARWFVRAGRGATPVLHALGGDGVRALADAPAAELTAYVAEFSRDDRRLAIAGTGFIGVWNTATGEVIMKIDNHVDTMAVRFSPDGQLLYSGSGDHLVHVWDVRSGAEIASLRAPDEVFQLAIDADGTRLAAATLGAAIEWQIASFAGDAAALRARSACRTRYEVANGTLRARAIEVERCDRPGGAR